MKNPLHKWLDKMEGKWETIFISLCELIVGVLLLGKPLWFTTWIIVASGIICGIFALKCGISYFRMDIIKASSQRELFKCQIFLGIGIFLILACKWLSSTQEVLDIVYGTALLLLSAEKIQSSVNLIRWQKPYWYVTGISAVLTLTLAILVLINPFPEQVIWIVLGCSLIVEAVLDLVAMFFAGKKTKVHTVKVKAEKLPEEEKITIKPVSSSDSENENVE